MCNCKSETECSIEVLMLLGSRYKDGPTGDEFPMAESLKLTIQRTLPYWNDQIVPDVSCTN